MFKTMASPRTGPWVVLTIGGSADAVEQQLTGKAMRIPRETKVEYAIAFLVETRGEILCMAGAVSSKGASRGENGKNKQVEKTPDGGP